MKAVMYRGIGQIAVEEIEKPEINADQYLVKVLCSGLCGTDIKTYKQGHRMFTPPCVLGHEFCAEIVEAGENMDKSLIGKKIVCAPYIGCGKCESCQTGFEELCWEKIGTSGAFTEYLTVDAELAKRGMMVLADDADVRQMTLSEPFACIFNSMGKSQVKEGQNCLIMGAGPMGLLHIEGLKLKGAGKIIVTEYNDQRGAVAAAMGATVINPSKVESTKKAIEEILDGESLHQIFVCVGIPAVVEEAMGLANGGTTINVFGGLKAGATITIDPNIIHYSEVKLVGTFGFSSQNFLEAAQALAEGKVDLSHLITNVYPLAEADKAFEMAAHPSDDVVKVLIDMQ